MRMARRTAFPALFAACLLLVASPGAAHARGRCATPEVVEARQGGQPLVASQLAPAPLDLVYLTPQGHFQIEYDTSGRDSVDVADADLSGVPDYVEWVGEAMEESWADEVAGLGFPDPIPPGQRYVVVLRDVERIWGQGTYGVTRPSASSPGGSQIDVHSDFARFYRNNNLPNEDPDGDLRGGIRVTCAHEFKHAIQLVQSGWTEPPGWLELDAVWVEDSVYDAINDYYNYLDDPGSPFTAPATSLLRTNYEDVTWQHFLEERYGLSMVMDYWDRRALRRGNEAPPHSYRFALEADGHDWGDSWAEYATWSWLTGSRAGQLGFGEAADYPEAQLASRTTTLPATLAGQTEALAMQFHEIVPGDLSVAGNLRVAFDGGAGEEWELRVVHLAGDGSVAVSTLPLVSDGSRQEFTVTQHRLQDFARVGVVVAMPRITPTAGAQFSYTLELGTETPVGPSTFALAPPRPNPAVGGHVELAISMGERAGPVELAVYDLMGRRVALLARGNLPAGHGGIVAWRGLNESGRRVPSGSYLVRFTGPEGEIVRRVVLLR